jgi:ABC-type multidrug transport system fused ATPase/permease subunit
MIRFALQLVRPYWKWLLIVAGAMVVETGMALASPWPLKIVLDSVFAAQPMPAALAWLPGADAGPLARLNLAVVLDRGDRPPASGERLSERALHRQYRSMDRP